MVIPLDLADARAASHMEIPLKCERGSYDEERMAGNEPVGLEQVRVLASSVGLAYRFVDLFQ
jgi:hypothetical protein